MLHYEVRGDDVGSVPLPVQDLHAGIGTRPLWCRRGP